MGPLQNRFYCIVLQASVLGGVCTRSIRVARASGRALSVPLSREAPNGLLAAA